METADILPSSALPRTVTPSLRAISALRVSAIIAEFWASLRRDLAGGYHPELHYMRGPGPAWHAKHAAG